MPPLHRCDRLAGSGVTVPRHAARVIVYLAVGGLLPVSCTGQPPAELVREELFSLGIGPLDEQLDLVRVAGVPSSHTTRVAMRDDLFYIANGNAGKVMQLSSHGDLLLLIYDPERNPTPVGLAPATDAAATRTAAPHRFHQLSHIAVDGEQRILVVDAVAEAGVGGAGQLVKRFSRDGAYLGALGRDGVDGTPFPFIQRLTVMVDDTLVVTAQTRTQWLVFWLDAAGRLQDQVALARVGDIGEDAGLTINEVIPQLVERRLLLFVESQDERDRAPGDDPLRVHLYHLASRSVLATYALPRAGVRRSSTSGGSIELAAPEYHPLGVTADGMLFLTRREDEQTRSVLVLDRGGRVVAQRRWGLDETGLGYVALGMSSEGALYGLLAAGDRARVVRWRGDLQVVR